MCENTPKHASPVANALHMLTMFLSLLSMAHLYTYSQKYAQNNVIRLGEQPKRWNDCKECENSRLQCAMRPFHDGAMWALIIIEKKSNKEEDGETKAVKKRAETKSNTWHCNTRMPTQTRAQSNQTKTVIEVLACAQTKNKLRPRKGKRLTDQVNLQSRDRSVFEWFLTLLHREGKLCFCLLSRGSLKHKCCENEELGVLRSKRKRVLQGPHSCGKMSGLISACENMLMDWVGHFLLFLPTVLSFPSRYSNGKKIAFCYQERHCLHKRSVQSQKKYLMT